jgi:hypothetical protein
MLPFLALVGSRSVVPRLRAHRRYAALPEFDRYEEDFRQKIAAPSMSTISSLMPWARR